MSVWAMTVRPCAARYARTLRTWAGSGANRLRMRASREPGPAARVQRQAAQQERVSRLERDDRPHGVGRCERPDGAGVARGGATAEPGERDQGGAGGRERRRGGDAEQGATGRERRDADTGTARQLDRNCTAPPGSGCVPAAARPGSAERAGADAERVAGDVGVDVAARVDRAAVDGVHAALGEVVEHEGVADRPVPAAVVDAVAEAQVAEAVRVGVLRREVEDDRGAVGRVAGLEGEVRVGRRDAVGRPPERPRGERRRRGSWRGRSRRGSRSR